MAAVYVTPRTILEKSNIVTWRQVRVVKPLGPTNGVKPHERKKTSKRPTSRLMRVWCVGPRKTSTLPGRGQPDVGSLPLAYARDCVRRARKAGTFEGKKTLSCSNCVTRRWMWGTRGLARRRFGGWDGIYVYSIIWGTQTYSSLYCFLWNSSLCPQHAMRVRHSSELHLNCSFGVGCWWYVDNGVFDNFRKDFGALPHFFWCLCFSLLLT